MYFNKSNSWLMKSLFFLGIAFLLPACTLTTPSMMNSNPLVIAEGEAQEQIPIEAVDDQVLRRIASDYRLKGEGPMSMMVIYNLSSTDFGLSNATSTGALISDSISEYIGYRVPVDVKGEAGVYPALLVSYETLHVQAPAGCGVTPGLYDYQTGRFIGDYRFGCGVETMFAKQIANPRDLYGVEGMSGGSGRRAGIMTDQYLRGEPNQRLEGLETVDRLDGGS